MLVLASTVPDPESECKQCSHSRAVIPLAVMFGPVVARPESPRARARAAVLEEIKAAARRQLEERGAAALSVRLVARDLSMSSSGMYRYFSSRDELLTALIIDAYNAIGEAVEQAEARVERSALFERYWAAATAARSWAKTRPQEYGLVFGSPVPGYVAPPETILPASRVPLTLARILRDTYEARSAHLDGSTTPSGVVDRALSTTVEPLRGLPSDVVASGILAWVELFGYISFELFGHLLGSVDDGDAFFRIACERSASSIGVRMPGHASR